MNELLSSLDDITRITININGTYNNLIYLEQNKNKYPDYEAQKTNILKELSFFKKSEDEEYNYFDDYQKCVTAINYLVTNSIRQGTNPSYNNVMLRIIGKLKDISLTYAFDNYMFLAEFKKSNFYDHLKKQNLDDNTIFTFLKDYIPDLNNQINNHFIKVTNNFLSNYPDDNHANEIIKIKYERLLTISGGIEDNFLSNENNTIELSHQNYNIKDETVSDYTSYILYQNSFNIIGKIIVNNYTLSDIIQFVTNTNYLNIPTLAKFKDQISSLKTLNSNIKNLLIDHLDSEITKHNNKGRTL